MSTLSSEARHEIVGALITRLRNLDTAAIEEWRKGPHFPSIVYGDQNQQAWSEFNRLLLDPAHSDAHIHLLNAWRRWPGSRELTQAEIPVYTSGRWLHVHFAPYTARAHPWSGYFERWLRVIASWPMQTSFLESAFRVHEALRGIPKAQCGDPVVVK